MTDSSVNILLTGGGGFIGSHLPVRGSGCYGAPAVETSLPDKQMPCGSHSMGFERSRLLSDNPPGCFTAGER